MKYSTQNKVTVIIKFYNADSFRGWKGIDWLIKQHSNYPSLISPFPFSTFQVRICLTMSGSLEKKKTVTVTVDWVGLAWLAELIE